MYSVRPIADEIHALQWVTEAAMSHMWQQVYLLADDGRCLFANRRATSISRNRDLLGHSLVEIFPSLSESGWSDRLLEVVQTRSSFCGDLKVTDWGGQVLSEMYPTAGGLGVVVSEREHMDDAPAAPDSGHRELVEQGAGAHRLHELEGLLAAFNEPNETVFEEILDSAIGISGMQRGIVQTVDRSSGQVHTACQRGFSQQSCRYFDSRPLARTDIRFVVDDIGNNDLIQDVSTLAVLRQEGVRSMQCTPVTDAQGTLRALVSTHSSSPATKLDHQVRSLDLLADQTREFLERIARASEQRSIEARGKRQRFEELRQTSTRVLTESHNLALRFVCSEISLANTYLDYAATTRYPESAARCMASARRAIEAAQRSLVRLRVDLETQRRLQDELAATWRRLKAE